MSAQSVGEIWVGENGRDARLKSLGHNGESFN